MFKRVIHAVIVSYLRKCAGAFHHFPYGPNGRYVVLMNEGQFHRYQHLARTSRPRAGEEGA